jgi:hypothetical protein
MHPVARSVGMMYRFFLILMFLGVLIAGIRLLRNWDTTVGSQDMGRAETPGELSYNKMQATVLWVFMMKLILWGAIAIDFS